MSLRLLVVILCTSLMTACTRPWILDVDAGFSGIAGSSFVPATAPAQTGMAPVRVLLIHGIGCHELDWSEALERNIATALFGPHAMSGPATYQLAFEKLGFEKLATAQLDTQVKTSEVSLQERRTRLCKHASQSAGPPVGSPVLQLDFDGFDYGFVTRRTAEAPDGRKLEFISVVWSPIAEAAKHTLLQDDLRRCKQKERAKGGGMHNICWRGPLSAATKRVVLNDRLADAVIYLGDRQRLIHSTVFRAVCFAALGSKSWLDDEKLCANALNPDAGAKARLDGLSLVFITESLGSRITFDALVGERREGLLRALQPVTRGVYMLANQLPLIELTESELRSSLQRYEPAKQQALKGLELTAGVTPEQWLKTANDNVDNVKIAVRDLILTPRREQRVIESRNKVSEFTNATKQLAEQKGSLERSRQDKYTQLAAATDELKQSTTLLGETRLRLSTRKTSERGVREQMTVATEGAMTAFAQATRSLIDDGVVTCGQHSLPEWALLPVLDDVPHRAIRDNLAAATNELAKRVGNVASGEDDTSVKAALAAMRAADQALNRVVQARSALSSMEPAARQSMQATMNGICGFADGPRDLDRGDALAEHIRQFQRYTSALVGELTAVSEASRRLDDLWHRSRSSKGLKSICGWEDYIGFCIVDKLDTQLASSAMPRKVADAATSDLRSMTELRDRAMRIAESVATAYDPGRRRVAALSAQADALSTEVQQLVALQAQHADEVTVKRTVKNAALAALQTDEAKLANTSGRLADSEKQRDGATQRLEEEQRKAEQVVLDGFAGVAMLLHSRSIARRFQLEYLEEKLATEPLAKLLKQGLEAANEAELRELFPIVAFSDPNDLLSYPIGATFSRRYLGSPFINVTLRAGNEYFWLLGHPVKAHTGHLNSQVVADLIAHGCKEAISRGATLGRRARCEQWPASQTPGSTSKAGAVAPEPEPVSSENPPEEAVEPQAGPTP